MEVDSSIIVKSNQFLNEIQSICEDFDLHPLKRALKSVRNFAEQDEYLDIAVLGQFKAGKSSFLNSFIGQSLLPVGNIPVTSVITIIKYGPREKVIVTFADGTTHEITAVEIPDYVSESGNPENGKDVFLVDIEVPSLSSIKTIRLVDTPGIGSVWKHNTETTTSWFPETGAVLLLVSAEKPISENELNLLQEIYQYSPVIAIVITKVDLFEEEKIKEIESFTAEVLKRTFHKDFPILKYSAYVKSSGYNQEINEKIILPLSLNQAEIFTKILHHKIGALVDSCLSYLEISYQASLKMESEKSKLKGIILDEHLNSNYIRRELLLIVGSYKEKTRESIRVYLQSFKEEIEDNLSQDYDAAFKSWHGNLYKVTRQFEEWLSQSLNEELKEILLKEEKSYELLNNAKKHLSFYLKSFRERLRDNLNQVLGVQMKPEEWEIGIGNLKKPNVSISRTFDFHLDMFWFFFPMFIFRNLFGRYFFKQINYEVDKNLHRLTSGLNEIINKEMDNLMAQAQTYMNEELNMIEILLSENKGNSSYVLERMNNIKDRFQTLISNSFNE